MMSEKLLVGVSAIALVLCFSAQQEFPPFNSWIVGNWEANFWVARDTPKIALLLPVLM
jgi:hypothetical protein